MNITNPLPYNYILDTAGNILRIKKVTIPAWDMDTDTTISVSHGLSDHTKILFVSATIIQDSGYPSVQIFRHYYNDPNTQTDCFIFTISDSNIVLFRKTGGHFDSPDYSNRPAGRGYCTILHQD